MAILTTRTRRTTKEMSAFEASKARTGNLEKLYRALLNIAPTSVASERAFSVSGSFVY
jgi:hypothetical protein